MSDKLIEVTVKTPETETHVAISALGTLSVVIAALTGSALLAHLKKAQ
ncbi:hypothetical protein [Weissella viridescens]|nr:hypothetical protein [Weissella viridescens]